MVIENRTGAGGTIGTGLVAKATPDGHTLLISSAAFTISAALHTNLPYDSIKDFAGVTRLGFSTTALVVPPSLGVRSVKELIALAQAKPLFFSHAGIGSSTHMNGERFRLAAGIKVVPVGFKGASDATIEVIAGRVQFAIVGLAGSLALHPGRKARRGRGGHAATLADPAGRADHRGDAARLRAGRIALAARARRDAAAPSGRSSPRKSRASSSCPTSRSG